MEEEKSQKAMAEKSQVDQQLADALKQIEQLRTDQNVLQETLDQTEQQLIDTNTEKLKLEVEKERSETQIKSIEEKLVGVETNVAEEKAEKDNLEDKMKDMAAASEDLAMQIGVLTEERDCARTREEELFDT